MTSMGKTPADYYPEQEAARRREAAIQRMLRTPPRLHAAVDGVPKAKKVRRKRARKSGQAGT
jgi:hypothetical protein